jgi:hypothetical protein
MRKPEANMKKPYESPKLRELGTLQELTQQQYNKVGNATDMYSQETNNEVVGSVIPLP